MVCLRTGTALCSRASIAHFENRKATTMFEIIHILLSFFAALHLSERGMGAPHEPVVIIFD